MGEDLRKKALQLELKKRFTEAAAAWEGCGQVKKAIASGNVSGQQAKIDSQKQLDQLNSKLQEAQSKLDEAKAAGSEKWETLKGGVEKTWQELEDGFKKLVD